MRQEAPNAFGGRVVRNFALTTPEFPCGRRIFPQMTRTQLFFGWPSLPLLSNETPFPAILRATFARYTKAMRFPK